VKRFLAAACLLFAATACGAETAVSVAQPGALPVKEWCAEYRQVFTDFQGGVVPGGPESLPAPADFLPMMEKLQSLAERAPADIRDDLKGLWTVPPGALTTPPSIPSIPPVPAISDDAGKALVQRLDRPMRWVSDNCGGAPPPGVDVPPGAGSPVPPMSHPTGDWQVVQRGTVGGSHWTFFRTAASDGGTCIAFEAEPGYIDWQARIGQNAPPGVSLPPVPPPSPPDDLGFAYKGKLPQCGPNPDLFGQSDPVVFWVQDQDETNRYNVLAGLVMDSARSLTITFQEGGHEVVTPVAGSFVATYDPHLHVARVVPDLGPDAQVSCEPLPPGGGPPGAPDVLALACNGSYSRR